jgi:rhamnosyltransferase
MEDEFRLSAVVILYYPAIDKLLRNIRQFIDFVDKLIIWENTPARERINYTTFLPEHKKKIICLGTGKNEGIAFALNRSIEWSVENRFTHILTMDQDSIWDNFDFFKHKILKFFIDPGIGIFAPVIYEQNKTSFPELTYVKNVITSGAVYDLKMFKEIGGFREDFFIDAVDLEYCYWANRNGYKTVVLGDSFLKQKYGNVTEHRLFNKVYLPANYSPFRLFHIVRNHIFLWKEYPELSDFEKKRIIKVYIINRLKEVILFEKDKFAKVFSVLKGILFGLFGIGEKKRNKSTQFLSGI